ncbi:acetolactate synthase large subunit [Mycolicibacterium palauense]|uniref:acetolactate synthase large subunit n=1 Tax=Mycolicibacterium palauense TaxID=2034511 RepID=UPI000BFF0F2F|nr:acetolactate synthase large subunit [Mycolicibacterium palauense]
MNGAQALIATLVDNGVEVCFANPGTSEMHFVAALDSVPAMRGVLALFEGVATGAADGYARMAGKPAGALLHLGPGLGNGLANLHNARRARVPMVLVVGDHATYHKKYDAPLESDIDAVAGTVSGWMRRTAHADAVAADAAEAIAAARAGTIATLILPADASWNPTRTASAPAPVSDSAPAPVSDSAPPDQAALRGAVDALRSGEPAMILLGGDAAGRRGTTAATRLAAATGARVLCETFPARQERGAGVPAVERLAYFAEAATAQLAGARHLILAGAPHPVSFFAYPGKPSDLVPEGCTVQHLAGPRGAAETLAALADDLAAGTEPVPAPAARPELPTGPLTALSAAAVVGALLPEAAIVVDEANTAGVALAPATAGAPAHDVLTLTGGAIGFGMPAAIGAAVAAPNRPVLSLQADGSAMYTVSALWTQAREHLDITTVILNNGAYDILRIELQRVGAENAASPGPRALDLLDLGRPTIDFVRIAEGMGVPARRATTAEELAAALGAAFAEPGPHLIEAVIPSMLG